MILTSWTASKNPPDKASSGIACPFNFSDLIWSDPVDNDSGDIPQPFKVNETRGCSYFYGSKAASKFLENNELLTIIRAHEAQLEGYKMHKWGSTNFPMVITIFSAPNYCDIYNNKGAVIKFTVRCQCLYLGIFVLWGLYSYRI